MKKDGVETAGPCARLEPAPTPRTEIMPWSGVAADVVAVSRSHPLRQHIPVSVETPSHIHLRRRSHQPWAMS